MCPAGCPGGMCPPHAWSSVGLQGFDGGLSPAALSIPSLPTGIALGAGSLKMPREPGAVLEGDG